MTDEPQNPSQDPKQLPSRESLEQRIAELETRLGERRVARPAEPERKNWYWEALKFMVKTFVAIPVAWTWYAGMRAAYWAFKNPGKATTGLMAATLVTYTANQYGCSARSIPETVSAVSTSAVDRYNNYRSNKENEELQRKVEVLESKLQERYETPKTVPSPTPAPVNVPPPVTPAPKPELIGSQVVPSAQDGAAGLPSTYVETIDASGQVRQQQSFQQRNGSCATLNEFSAYLRPGEQVRLRTPGIQDRDDLVWLLPRTNNNAKALQVGTDSIITYDEADSQLRYFLQRKNKQGDCYLIDVTVYKSVVR